MGCIAGLQAFLHEETFICDSNMSVSNCKGFTGMDGEEKTGVCDGL